MTIYLHSLGCDKNLVDSEIMLGKYLSEGYKAVADPADADIIVVNTCGFIQEAVEEAIETILEMAAYKEKLCKKLIVMGCMAQRYKNEIQKEIPEVDEVLGVIDSLDEKLFELRTNTMPMHVAYVKISEGCDNNCTYCTIPSIRGAYRERAPEAILKECERLVAGGAKEIVLVAQDTAKYQGLPRLLSEIAKIEGLGWLRLMYAYPEHISEELIQTIAIEEKICNYIDMPIQHSHDDVIQRMARKSTNEGLRALIVNLKKHDIAIRTTLIAGFPAESEEEYLHLRNFIKEMQFDQLGVFAYSQEDGTPAAEMGSQIADKLKETRRDELMAIQAKIADKKVRGYVGQTIKVMVDGSVGEEEGQIAYSGRDQRNAYDVDGAVFFNSEHEYMSGEFVMVKITRAVGYDMYGEEVNKIEN